MSQLRFGIIGTGGWSRRSHIPAASASDDVEFVGAIGRHDDVGEFLHRADAVGFAVPPDVQSGLALRAIRAGKHVLLEKPIALDLDEAETLAREVEDRGLASIVFLTRRFVPEVAAWLDGLAVRDDWSFGRAEILSAALADMPAPGWRAEYGGLWDVGPHALSILWPVLGPVTAVTALTQGHDLVAALLEHESGATSTMATSLGMPRAGAGDTFLFAGPGGRSEHPVLGEDAGRASAAYGHAIAALAARVAGATGHPCDARFGAEIVRVLDGVDRSLDTGRRVEIS
jgi:predicted dehydrogenase